jgi:hypothetical protein
MKKKKRQNNFESPWKKLRISSHQVLFGGHKWKKWEGVPGLQNEARKKK